MSCLNTATKYFLLITNLLVFILAIAVLGVTTWSYVDKPSFLGILDDVEAACDENVGNESGCDDIKSTVSLYTSAVWVLITISVLVIIISFFGCCGAWKESKCMLGTYFTIILALFVAMLVGAIVAYSGNLDDQIKKPLKSSLKYYDDQKTDTANDAYRKVWNEVQAELKCCGIDGVEDWRSGDISPNFPSGFKQPLGCCEWKRDDVEITGVESETCRRSEDQATSETYYFKGCYTAIKDQVKDQQSIVVGVAIGVVVVMFLNMLFSFSLCMMSKSNN